MAEDGKKLRAREAEELSAEVVAGSAPGKPDAKRAKDRRKQPKRGTSKGAAKPPKAARTKNAGGKRPPEAAPATPDPAISITSADAKPAKAKPAKARAVKAKPAGEKTEKAKPVKAKPVKAKTIKTRPAKVKSAKAGAPVAEPSSSKGSAAVPHALVPEGDQLTAPEALDQIAALPVRRQGETLEVCLVTTRDTRRWTIPKGWPMKGKKDWTAARIEAAEEAGLAGKVARRPIGSYLYFKRRPAHLDLVRVTVFLMEVSGQSADWKEAAERDIAWFPAATAAFLVDEEGLRSLILDLAPPAEDGQAGFMPS